MPIQNTNAILENNLSEELDQYVLVRTGLFHYLKFIDDQKELFNSNGPLESKPNLVFYQENSETKVMLDYTNASDKDKTFLQILFNGLNDFSGLSLGNASYLNEKDNIDTNFNIDLYFREYKNNILFAKTTSSISSNNLQKVFEGEYFISVPTISSTSSWDAKSSESNSLLISVNPKSSLSFSSNYSISKGDLIEIINPNSQNNNQKYEVLDFININNKEILKLKTKAKNESLLGKSTIINIYAKTKKKETENKLNLDTQIAGCCYSYVDNVYYNNATEYECDIRTSGKYEFFKGTCSEASEYIVPMPTITVNSRIIETQKLQYVLQDQTLLEDLYIKFDQNRIYINDKLLDVFAVARGKMYRIIQDDESNLGLPLRIAKKSSTQRAEIDYYADGLYGTTNPEGIGTELYFKVTDKTPDLLYFLTEGDLNIIPVEILVV